MACRYGGGKPGKEPERAERRAENQGIAEKRQEPE
jgi:hypothetical protein